MNTSNSYDSLEQIIYSEGIRIQTIDVHPDMDLLLILLNTGGVLQQPISRYARLQNASKESLITYELTGKGTGVHWPELDEDLSLKGFLRDALLTQVVRNNKVA